MASQRAGILLALAPAVFASHFLAPSARANKPRMVFACAENNDLYLACTASGMRLQRCDGAVEAVGATAKNGCVLLLPDGYPDKTVAIGPAVYEKARAAGVRLYVEYPAALPGVETEPPRATQWERAVVSSDWFGSELRPLRILAIHDCHFVPTAVSEAHIVVARIAGFDTAVFGLPEATHPILFEHPSGDLLVATTKLSQFITARYAPTEAWKSIWHRILTWCARGDSVPELNWKPTVRTSYPPTVSLPDNVEVEALRRGTRWFVNSRLLSCSQRQAEIHKLDEAGKSIGPTPSADAPIGDGSLGILEGFDSTIRYDGTQAQRIIHRSDCNGESAMGLAFGGRVTADAQYSDISANILDYWYFESIAQRGLRADPDHPAFGLASWGTTNLAWETAYYGDDNARLLLGTMAASALLETDRWDEAMLKCLLANLRTTGPHGFRANSIGQSDLERHGWRHYFNKPIVVYAPHYQAYLWACYIWAYRATGYDLFFERAKTAIRMTMFAYADQWRWTNGITQERARMLLPLAWLVRIEDTPEHRAWLRRIAKDLLALQDPCGAIREELGREGKGAYGPPCSNEDYGKNEATLIQANGDPVCDLLYTTNFAFIGLHEAAAATDEPLYTETENKLAKFLCRIQVRSERHPELDGGWFRAFDFNRWEYWASNADAGWGAWSIETGWTQGWIVATLGLRQMNTSLWDLTAGSRIKSHFARLHPIMVPGSD